jgi:hypothetical protein
MRWRKSLLFNFILSLLTCVCLVTVANISTAVDRPFSPDFSPAIALDLSGHLQDAEMALLAQAQPAPQPTTPTTAPLKRYVAVMTRGEIVPSAVSTRAFGAAGAVLVGDRLVIRGDYSNLTSPLRDYATDPLNPPNPNITSGIHLHQGDPTKNGPFQYALEVQPGADQLSGRFRGEYTLTPTQLEALGNGTLYVDLHTKQNRGGELRGILKPY